MSPFAKVRAELKFARLDLAKALNDVRERDALISELRASLAVAERAGAEWQRIAERRAERIVALETGQ